MKLFLVIISIVTITGIAWGQDNYSDSPYSITTSNTQLLETPWSIYRGPLIVTSNQIPDADDEPIPIDAGRADAGRDGGAADGRSGHRDGWIEPPDADPIPHQE